MSVGSVAQCLRATNYAKSVSRALFLLREDGSRSYPREAHHSHLVAAALEVAGHTPILEADYWRSYYTQEPGRGDRTLPMADVWCPRAFGESDQEIFIEIKLAGLWGRRRSIGSRQQWDVVSWWAQDVWRLLVGTNRARCGFVLCAFGDVVASPWKPTTKTVGVHRASVRADVRADDVYEELCAVQSDTAMGAVDAFLVACERLLGAEVTKLPSASEDGVIHVWSAIVEWSQDNPADSAWVAS